MPKALDLEGSDARQRSVLGLLGQAYGDNGDGQDEPVEGDARETQDAVEAPETRKPPAKPSQEPQGERPRDEAGRFTKGADDAKPAAPPAQGGPQVVTLNYRGRPVELTLDRVVELAQQGFDYSEKMRAMNAEKATLEQDKAGYEGYREYKQYMNSHPELAKTVFDVLKHYEDTNAVPVFENGAVRPAQGGSGVTGVPRDLFDRITRLEGMVQPVFEDRRQEAFSQLVGSAIQSRPILKKISDQCRASGRPDLAAQKLGELLKSDPGADVNVLADVVATDFRRVAETLGAASYVEDKQRDSQRFPDTSVGGAPAPGVNKTTYNSKDLKSGKVRSAATAFMRSVQD